MDRRISKEYRDSDGYWIELKGGWQNGADPGCHGIHENTKREAHSYMRNVIPCNCADCLKRSDFNDTRTLRTR